MSTFTNLPCPNMVEYHMLYTMYADLLPRPVWRDAVHACAVRGWLRARRQEAAKRILDPNFSADERASWQARALDLTELIEMTNVILRRVFGYRRAESEKIPRDREALAAVWSAIRGDPTFERFLG